MRRKLFNIFNCSIVYRRVAQVTGSYSLDETHRYHLMHKYWHLKTVSAVVHLSFRTEMDSFLEPFTHVGRIVDRNDWRTPDDLFTGALNGNRDANVFIECMCATKKHRRRTPEAAVLIAQYGNALRDNRPQLRRRCRALNVYVRSLPAAYVLSLSHRPSQLFCDIQPCVFF